MEVPAELLRVLVLKTKPPLAGGISGQSPLKRNTSQPRVETPICEHPPTMANPPLPPLPGPETSSLAPWPHVRRVENTPLTPAAVQRRHTQSLVALTPTIRATWLPLNAPLPTPAIPRTTRSISSNRTR